MLRRLLWRSQTHDRCVWAFSRLASASTYSSHQLATPKHQIIAPVSMPAVCQSHINGAELYLTCGPFRSISRPVAWSTQQSGTLAYKPLQPGKHKTAWGLIILPGYSLRVHSAENSERPTCFTLPPHHMPKTYEGECKCEPRLILGSAIASETSEVQR